MAFCAGASAENLVANGQSDYSIVLQPGASPSEQLAAEELQSYLKACTGAELAIVSERPVDSAPMIVLGCGPVSEALGVKPDPEDLGEQGYLVQTVAPHLVIAGTSAAGTLYGVYDFIEEHLGVRWYAPGVTKTPEVVEVKLPEVTRLVKPAFLWRQTSYAWPGKDAAFMAHARCNAGGGGADHPYGIQHAHDGRAHSYFRFIGTGEFFDEHPEYFSEIGGVRLGVETQLCLTNPEVLDIVTERMLKRMADLPGHRQHNFSQMDYYNYCECDTCRAMNEQYGTTGGTQFWFVNELAKRTSQEFPDKLIGTLAYTFTEEPPRGMRMHPNVAVWLCHMFPSCQSHPVATCPNNADYKRRATAWAKQCSHVYIWHYPVDFAHYYSPFPNLRAMAADMRFYRDIGVEGVYLQAMGHTGGGGEFSLLRPYYGTKLLWNPDQDADAILRDFLQGYYGAAWEPIWQYISMLHDKVDNENVHMHLYTNPAQGFLPDGLMRRAGQLFNEAEDAVKDDETLLERVRVARMPLTYARIFPRNGYKLEDGKLAFQGDIAPVEETQAFLERMSAHGFQTIREWGGDPSQLMMWTFAGNMPTPYERIRNGHLIVDVLPAFGGRAIRIIHTASAECITSNNVARSLFFPFSGGEETRMGTTHQAPTSSSLALFSVAEKTGDSVTMEAATMGFNLRRILTLVPDKPVLRVENVLTNPSDKPKLVLLRSHIEFDLGDLMSTKVSFTNRAGEAVERDMAPIVAGLREGEFYRDEAAPNGTWTLTGSKGLQVTHRFDPEQVRFTWLYAYPADLNELEAEVWADEVTLGPGESMTFAHELEVRPMAE
jgi:Domain of unknown function (DUF4838)/Glycosyl hydrolase family 67 N-terminus